MEVCSVVTKLSSPRAFKCVVMTVVAVVVPPFFTAIIVTTWQMVRASRPSNLVDSLEQVGVVDLPPFIVGMRATRCRRGQRHYWSGWSYSQRGWSCNWWCWRSDRCRSDLRLLHGRGGEAIEAGGPGDLADGEHEIIFYDREVRDDDHQFVWEAVRTPPPI